CTMPAPYPHEFRDDVVRVARSREDGVTIAQIAKDLGVHEMTLHKCGLTLLMLTPEMAGRAGLREGCRHEQAEEVHAGVPPRGSSFGAGYGSADRACGRGDRR